MVNAVTIQSYRIWCAAVDARDRASAVVRENPKEMPFDAMIAVVLAAAAVEAFVNEVAALIEMTRSSEASKSRMESQWLALGDALIDLEDSHGSVKLKYVIAGHVLGRPYARGENPFQDFSTLVTLRNEAMHLKRQDPLVGEDNGSGGFIWRSKWPNHVVALQQRGLVREFGPNVVANSFDALQTPELATWACDASDQMIRSLLNLLPDGTFSPFQVLHLPYRYRQTEPR
jgi:hypothetical protein